MDGLKNGKRKIDLWEEYLETMAKRYQAIEMYEREFKKQRVIEDSLQLREWQDQLYNELRQQPGDRTIHWYCDPQGGAGKSRFAKYITRQFPNTLYVDGGGARDVKTAFEGQTICIVNLPRTVAQIPLRSNLMVRNCRSLQRL